MNVSGQNDSPAPIRNVDGPRNPVPAAFQIVLIIISLVTISAMLYKKTVTFSALEQLPGISQLTPDVIKEFGSFIQIVDVGLIVNRFDDFNMTTKEFIFDGVVWFQFDPGTISVETLSKFEFENGTILQKSEPLLNLENDRLTAQYTIRVRFVSELDHAYFPIDTHRIGILLINRAVSPREINFESREQYFNIQADVSNTGWEEFDRSVREGFIEINLNPEDAEHKTRYPAILFEIDYVRNSVRYAFSILLPLALIFYVMLFSVSLPITTAISITAAGITAILAYRFVIENLSPHTGFFMLSDFLFFMFLSATIVVFILNIAEMSVELSSRTKKFLLILLHAVIIGVALYFLLLW